MDSRLSLALQLTITFLLHNAVHAQYRFDPKLYQDLNNQPRIARQVEECPDDQVSFEMVTGYVYTAPADMLDSQPGTLMLTDCIDTCRRNASCQSINYETGLCVLFASNADGNVGELTVSFSLRNRFSKAHRICLLPYHEAIS